MIPLADIGKKYPTSKNITGFIEIYEKYFKDYREKEIKGWSKNLKKLISLFNK